MFQVTPRGTKRQKKSSFLPNESSCTDGKTMEKSLLKALLTDTGEFIMRRKSMGRRRSRKIFRKYAKSRKVNYRRPVSRGGIRF